MLCNHIWQVLSETVTESKFECAMDKIKSAGRASSLTVPHQMSCVDRKHIQVFTCYKCGKLKRFVEDI